MSVVSAQVQGVDKMLAVLENALEQYNESNAVMDLVLFEDAMKHIARISRIVRSRRPVVESHAIDSCPSHFHESGFCSDFRCSAQVGRPPAVLRAVGELPIFFQ